jgi:hypothetical protein
MEDQDQNEDQQSITGQYAFIGNPCTMTPCLPGMVYAVITDGNNYYLTVNGYWVMENNSWEGYTPQPGDAVRVSGVVSEKLDIYQKRFFNLEVVRLSPAG